MGGVLRERSKRFELEEDRESVAEETEVGSWRSIPRLGTVGGSKSSPKVVQRVTTRKVRDIAAASEGWPVPSWCMWQKAAELPPWHRVVRVRCPIANNLCSHDRWERPAGWIDRSFCSLIPLLPPHATPPACHFVSPADPPCLVRCARNYCYREFSITRRCDRSWKVLATIENSMVSARCLVAEWLPLTRAVKIVLGLGECRRWKIPFSLLSFVQLGVFFRPFWTWSASPFLSSFLCFRKILKEFVINIYTTWFLIYEKFTCVYNVMFVIKITITRLSRRRLPFEGLVT